MREIKFRFWDKIGKGMIVWNVVRQTAFNRGDMQLCYDLFGNNPDIEKMQFTGLLDKNGKEIYEGDILSAFMESIGPMHVVFEEGCFNLYNRFGKWGPLFRLNDLAFSEHYTPEIIGNSFENPELFTTW